MSQDQLGFFHVRSKSYCFLCIWVNSLGHDCLESKINLCENAEIRAVLPFFKEVVIFDFLFRQFIKNKNVLVPIGKENS